MSETMTDAQLAAIRLRVTGAWLLAREAIATTRIDHDPDCQTIDLGPQETP